MLLGLGVHSDATWWLLLVQLGQVQRGYAFRLGNTLTLLSVGRESRIHARGVESVLARQDWRHQRFVIISPSTFQYFAQGLVAIMYGHFQD